MLAIPMISRIRGALRPRIVVADDEVSMRELIAVVLRSNGFDVVVASDGDAALAAILSEGADGLVSDFQMPGLDGLMLCRVLRALRAYAALPIVVFTGVGETDPRLLPLRDINELRVLHKPMGLGGITPALMAMIPMAMTGFGVPMNPRAPAGHIRRRDGVAGALLATIADHGDR